MAKKKQNSDICSEDVEILDDVWDQEEKIFRDPTARTVMTFNFQEPDDEKLLTNETLLINSKKNPYLINLEMILFLTTLL